MSDYLTNEQVRQLNEKHGWFEFGDAQSDVSKAFAQDAIAMYLSATEAAKATSVAVGKLPEPDYKAGTKGMLCEDTWTRETVEAYGQACAEAARQPAPVVEKKLSDTIKLILVPEDFGILDPELAKRAINFANAMVHQAALAATAAPVTLKDHEIAQVVNKLRDIAIEFHSAQQLRERIAHVIVPILCRSQP